MKSAVVLIDRPVFTSVRNAVKLGICYAGLPRGSTMWEALAGGDARPGWISDNLDVAGQAGIVMSALRHDMTPYHLAVLTARLLPRRHDCACGSPCCSGHRPNREWEGAVAMVALGAQSMCRTELKPDLAQSLVARIYARSGRSIAQLARRHNVDVKLVEWGAEVFRRCVERESEGEAWMQAADSLRRIGVVGDD